MIDNLAWASATVGLLLGGVLTLVPGFPGCMVALLGLVAFAGMTDFDPVGPPALMVAALLAAFGALAQLSAPALASRALGGTAGVATGAALGALVGLAIPVPGLLYGTAVLGAIALGLVGFRGGLARVGRGVFGASLGCCGATVVDGASVLGIGAVLALSDTWAALQAAGP